VLGAAARRLRDGPAGSLARRIDPRTEVAILGDAAVARLRMGQVLLTAGTSASGLVPQPGPSLKLRLTSGLVALLALVAMGAASAYGFRAAQVPQLPHATAPSVPGSAGGGQR